MYACLLELRVGAVEGFDLSALNAYWWYPGAERMQLARMPHRRLSAPFAVHSLDLQARVDAALASQASDSAGSSSRKPAADASDSEEGDGSAASAPSAAGSEAAWELDTCLDVPVTADGQWNAVAFWFEVQAGPGSNAVVTSWGDAGVEDDRGIASTAASSWDQAVQYLDTQAVNRGASVKLRVRQDTGQIVFTSTPPQCRPRHALGELGWLVCGGRSLAGCAVACQGILCVLCACIWLNLQLHKPQVIPATHPTHAVPRWHFDMVLDDQRNAAYDAAIRRAVAAKRAAGCTDILALDVGAGTGLLSMMAARWVVVRGWEAWLHSERLVGART